MGSTRRGRAPTEAMTQAFESTAAAVLARAGYRGLSVAGLAAAVGTGRPSFYRRWPDVAHLVLALLVQRWTVPVAETGSLHTDLLLACRHEVDLLADPVVRRGLLGVLGAAGRDEQLAERVRAELLTPWHDVVAEAVAAAVRRGEVDAVSQEQVEFAVDLLRGAGLLGAVHLEADHANTGPDRAGDTGTGGGGSEALAARTAAAALGALAAH